MNYQHIEYKDFRDQVESRETIVKLKKKLISIF